MQRVTRHRFLLGAFILLVESVAHSVANSPSAPKALQPPKDQVLILHLNAKGQQIYVCEAAAGVSAWKFKAPQANLYAESGELFGRHFAGPTWESNDGSRVVGKVMASAPSPDSDAIPWLLLTATSHDGAGVFSKVQSIQRLNTKGGVAPSTGCSAQNQKEETQVPYEASYYFYETR